MKINIVLITYNHSQFIRQSLESILMQVIEEIIIIEIIVADDCSTDDTFLIIQEYAKQSIFKFIFLSNEKNLGFIQNYKRTFDACDGDYIAILEGDDYWTDPLRIMKHINFLESHRECVMSMNRITFLNEFSNKVSVLEWTSNDDFQYIDTKQMALGNKLGNLSACVFRNSEIKKMKPDLFDLQIADWMIGMVLSEYGFIVIFKEPMSVYRIHQNGQWSRMNKEEQLQKMNEIIDSYNKYLDYKYDTEFTIHKNMINENNEPLIKKKSLHNFVPSFIVRTIKILMPNVILRGLKKS